MCVWGGDSSTMWLWAVTSLKEVSEKDGCQGWWGEGGESEPSTGPTR